MKLTEFDVATESSGVPSGGVLRPLLMGAWLSEPSVHSARMCQQATALQLYSWSIKNHTVETDPNIK